MTTITNSTAIGITLSSPPDLNPIIVNPGVTVSNANDAVFGNGIWTIENYGLIAATVGTGVYLPAGGSVTNAASTRIVGGNGGNGVGILAGNETVSNGASAYIGGGASGIYLVGGIGIVVNSGSIVGRQQDGISVNDVEDSVTNTASGSITGGNVGVNLTREGVVNNYGSISATGAYGNADRGVDLFAGGTITNALSASITGPHQGVYVLTGPGTVVNRGTIAGTTFDGIGVDLLDGGTVTNAGTISGAGGTAIYLGGTGSNLLVVDPGAAFQGNVGGGSKATNALELASASSAGTLSGLGTLYTNFGAVTVDSGAAWYLTGANTIAAGSLLTNNGTLTLSGAVLSDAGSLVNNGAIVLDGGTLKLHSTAVGPVTVVNPNDVVIAQPGSDLWINSTVDYTLPTNVDALFLYGGAQGAGNSDTAGNALWALDAASAQTLTGNSANDAFVVYNSSDVVVPKAGSHDIVYAGVNYTLPTGIDTLLLEAGTQAVGNSDAAGDALYAGDAGIAQTLTGNSANDAFVVYNSADVVTPKAGSHDVVYTAVNYTLPTGVDTLILEGTATRGVGNSDAAGDTLYAGNANVAAALIGNSHNDTFAVYNSADVVVGMANSTDTVYAAASFVLPTNVDTLFLEGNATQGAGNNDAANALYGDAGVASTLVAGSGTDILSVTGTAGTTLTGGVGADTFAFPNQMGHDVVTNFSTAKDTLQFNATLFSNFSAAMADASQVGANTVFTIDANDTVTLDNLNKTSLTAGNFHFS